MNHAQRKRPSLRQLGTALPLAVLALLCALVVAACGSSSAASAPASSTGTSSTSASLTAFRDCLKQHGFTAPQGGRFGGGGGGGGGQPGAGGGNRPSPSSAFQKAMTACASLRPAGGFGGGGGRPGGGAAGSTNPAFAKFQACLKDHGGSTGKSSAAAIAACRSLLPNGGQGNAAGSGTTTTAGQ
jgi:hypothetical protein